MSFSQSLEPRIQDKAADECAGGPASGFREGCLPVCVSPGWQGYVSWDFFCGGHEPSQVFCFPNLTSPSCATPLGGWRFHQRNLAVTGRAKPQRPQGNRSVQRRLCPASAQERAWLSGLRARSLSFPETVLQVSKSLCFSCFSNRET